MQNKITLRTLFILSCLVCALFLSIGSCKGGGNPSSGDNKTSSDADREKDAKFCVNAMEITLAQIELGKQAQSKSTNSEVKALGKMMTEEHNMKLTELRALGEKKLIPLPASTGEEGSEQVRKMGELSGKDFDKEYCELMVDEHKKAINVFEDASENCVDADIKTWAANTLANLRKHLEEASTCRDHIKNEK